MKKIFAAIALGFFCVAAVADPCMDANVSALGYYDTQSDATYLTADEIHLDEHGC